jgi:ribonuclease P protein component
MLVFQKSAQPRFAVVVSKKVAKTAVTRNRLRRRVYEFVRTTSPSLPAIEAMFIMQKGASALSAAQLREEVLLLLKKIY